MKTLVDGKADGDPDLVRVLYVDDTLLDVDRVHAALDAVAGFELCGCTTPGEMESRLARGGWSLLVAELGVFGWGTFGLLDRLRDSHPDLPVAIVAGAGSDELATEAVKRGAVDFIRKADIDPRSLPRLLRHMVDKHRLQQGNRLLEHERDLLFANSMDLLAVAGFDGRFRVLNPAWQRTLGWSPEEMSGMPWIHLVHPDDHAASIEVDRRLLGGEPVANFRNRCRHKDGNYRTISWNSVPLSSERLIFAVARDVTEKMETEERLRLLDMAVESADNGIVITSRSGIILWVNAAFTRQTGYARGEVIGRTPSLLRSGRHDASFYEAMWRTIIDGGVWRGELVNRRKDGSLFTEEMTITPLRGADGEVSHFIAIKVDVSEERRLRDQLAQAGKMESIGRLAGGIAHDFNNLLQAILGYAELLRSGMKEEDSAVADVEQIRSSAKQAAELTRQLLAFSRRQLIRTQPLDINTIVRGTGRLLQRVIGEHIRLHLELAENLRPIMADPGQVESVIMNLSSNARDAMPDGGRLTIATRAVSFQEQDLAFYADARPGRFICLSVTDTGTGMEPEVLRHIFEPFYTTKAMGKGTGLGLSTVHGILHQHGGWVHVYSEKGQGTCFKLYLPTVDQPAAAAPDTGSEPKQAGERHILIVEDEDGICQLAARVLRERGYRVTMAHSAGEARLAFQSCNAAFDLLFCDVVLPDQNGVALVDSLRRLKPDIAVLMVSGYPDEYSRWETIRERGYPFLQKPYPAREMLRVIRGLLEPVPAADTTVIEPTPPSA